MNSPGYDFSGFYNSISAWATDFTNPGSVYYVSDNYSGDVVYVFPSFSDLLYSTNYQQVSVPHGGTGMTAFSGRFYVQDPGAGVSNPSGVDVYDTSTWSFVMHFDIPNIPTSDNSCGYSWGGYSCIDIEMDSGSRLYVIAADNTNGDRQTIYEINPSDGSIIYTTPTDSPARSTLGDCWIMCRKMYCLSSYSSNYVYYQYDMDSMSSTYVSIPLQSYGYTTSLLYSPYENYLYQFDSGRLVLYTSLSTF